ncbi:AbfB domain-containing protein [Lentzea sp. NPDC092896]|uniref:AbfB domain-containing protein n=1 Tax=Lentzea sp. NPDC092896 TaxID=3364127 RepID=UPI00382D6E63
MRPLAAWAAAALVNQYATPPWGQPLPGRVLEPYPIGLADARCYSFESPNDGSALFRDDATFCARPGLNGTGVTLESINLPGFDRPRTLTADSTWTIVAPWAP